MRVLAFDPFVGAERYRELGVEKAASAEDVYAVADFITVHLPKTPDTEGWLDAEAFAEMRDGVRILNVARGGLIDEAALKDALDSGKVAGAALDVFRGRADHRAPAVRLPNVVVTPHLGASTAEATDRAGYQAAEQVVAALTGGAVTTAVNMPGDRRRGPRGARPVHAAVHGARALRDGAGARACRSSASRWSSSAASPSATRARSSIAVLLGVLSGHTEEDVNAVNVPAVAAERGIELVEIAPRERARLHRPHPRHGLLGDGAPARRRHDARPAPPPAPARGVGPALQPPARART